MTDFSRYPFDDPAVVALQQRIADAGHVWLPAAGGKISCEACKLTFTEEAIEAATRPCSGQNREMGAGGNGWRVDPQLTTPEMSEQTTSRPTWPTAREFERMGEAERLRRALLHLVDAVEHHYGHVNSAAEQAALGLAKEALYGNR